MMLVKLYGMILFLHGLSDGTAQLVGTRGVLEAAADAFQTLQHVFYFHAFHQSAHALCVAVAATVELHVPQDTIFDFKFNGLAAGALGVLSVFHNLLFQDFKFSRRLEKPRSLSLSRGRFKTWT